MTSKVVEAQLAITGVDKGASKVFADVAKAMEQAAKTAKVTKPIEDLAKRYEDLEKRAKATDAALGAQKGAAALSASMGRAQEAAQRAARGVETARQAVQAFEGQKITRGTEIARQMAEATKGVREAERVHRSAEREVRKVSRAVEDQARALREAERAASAMGAPLHALEQHQRNLRAAYSQTTETIQRQILVEQRAAKISADRREAGKALASVAGVAVGHKAGEVRAAAAHTYAEFDDKIRYQTAVADLTPAERKSRMDQAVRLGATTSFNDLQVLEAQLTLAQRNVKKEFIEPFVGEIVNYAQAMNTDLPSAAKTLEGVIFSTNQNVENASTALTVMRRNVDLLVKTAKVGGLDNQGVAEGFKFGGASGSGAGLSNETIGTILAALHRAGYAGSEAGVATRAIASKLVSPTSKGLSALAAMDIDYNKFTKMPDGLSAKAFDSKFRQDFGKSLTESQKSRIQKTIDEGTFTDKDGEEQSIVSDRGQFANALSGILAESFAKTKKGKTSAKDAAAIARSLEQFHKFSVESVNAEGLLQAILEKSPTLGQANAIFTDKHGGKVLSLSKRIKDFTEIREALGHVQSGFAKGIGDERMGGFSGARKRLSGSALNVETAMGRAWDDDANGGVLTKVTDLTAKLTQHVAELDKSVLAAGSAILYLGGKASEAAGTFGLAYAAIRLTGSATALDAAAIKIGGGSVANEAAKGAGAVGAGGAAAAALPLAVGAAVVGGAVLAGGRQQPEEMVRLRSELGDLNKALERQGEGLFRAQSQGGDTATAQAKLDATRKRVDEIKQRLRALDAGTAGPAIANDRESLIGRERLRARAAEARGTGTADPAIANDREGLIARERLRLDAAEPGPEAGSKARADIEKLRADLAAINAEIARAVPDFAGAVAAPLSARKAEIERLLAEAEDRLKRFGEVGRPVGEQVGQGIADGVAAKAPKVEVEGRGIVQRLKDLFSDGIKIPISLDTSGVPAGGGEGGVGSMIQRASLSTGDGVSLGRSAGGVHRAYAGGALPVGSGNGAGHVASQSERAAFIRQAARREGIDPNVALRVAQSEGFGRFVGDKGTSFGDFQLHYGGSGIRGMNSRGEGDLFTRATGLDARDPKNWKAADLWALRRARQNGWGAWHGAKAVGIGNRQGIGVKVPEERLRDTPEKPKKMMPERELPPDYQAGGGTKAADRMEEAVARFEEISLRTHHTVQVEAAPGLTARTKSMRAHGTGPLKPNVGVSMPDAEGGRWI